MNSAAYPSVLSARDAATLMMMRGAAGPSGYLMQIDDNWQNILGWSPAEMLADPLIARLHPDDQAAMVAAIHHLHSGGDYISFVGRCRRKDGSYLWLTWHAMPHIGDRLTIDLIAQPCPMSQEAGAC